MDETMAKPVEIDLRRTERQRCPAGNDYPGHGVALSTAGGYQPCN